MSLFRRKRRFGLALFGGLALAGLFGFANLTDAHAADRFITLGSTTSTQNSGLFEAILPLFAEETGIEVRVIAVGTGQALKLGERGDVDLILVHDKTAENRFVESGFGIDRRDVMYNDFVIVGPVTDPAGIRGTAGAVAALTKIAESRSPFISRGDDSGTNRLEMRLWDAAGIDAKMASGSWYRESGSGMGATLNMASGVPAYTLTDRGTWLAFQNKGDLVILNQGDAALFNQYGVTLVNPARHTHVKAEDARAFRDWLISPDGQAAIAAYKIDGEQLFFPNAEQEAAALLAPPRPGLEGEDKRLFALGQALFDTHAQAPPAPGAALAGLGPVFNVEGCGGCHIADGRGRPPLALGEPLHQMVIRLSVVESDGAVVAHPAYGVQLNDKAVDGVRPEGRAFVEYRGVKGAYGDGTPYELASPVYGFLDMAFGRLDNTALVSARVPLQTAGAGLLEAVPEAGILALADPEDADGDGVSGRPNHVENRATGKSSLGRFGWKANQPSLRQQIAHAARTDIGLTSELYPEEDCPPVQAACRIAGSHGVPELSEESLDALETYLIGLDAPVRRGSQAAAATEGERLFGAFGCDACHVPSLPVDVATLPGRAPASIAAYTDLLLHDMGEGLADGRPDGEASGREWRTAPLWGIGLTAAVNGHTRFLHDGRARDLAEAILWHGGEAEAAREAFRTASADHRSALLAFLNSL